MFYLKFQQERKHHGSNIDYEALSKVFGITQQTAPLKNFKYCVSFLYMESIIHLKTEFELFSSTCEKSSEFLATLYMICIY